jgi:hypothetical protein
VLERRYRALPQPASPVGHRLHPAQRNPFQGDVVEPGARERRRGGGERGEEPLLDGPGLGEEAVPAQVGETVSEGGAQEHGPAGPHDARELRGTTLGVCDMVPRQEQQGQVAATARKGDPLGGARQDGDRRVGVPCHRGGAHLHGRLHRVHRAAEFGG